MLFGFLARPACARRRGRYAEPSRFRNEMRTLGVGPLARQRAQSAEVGTRSRYAFQLPGYRHSTGRKRLSPKKTPSLAIGARFMCGGWGARHEAEDAVSLYSEWKVVSSS